MARAGRQDVAEAIAEVVADIRAGRARRTADDPIVDAYLTGRARQDQPVVDATGVYKAIITKAVSNVEVAEPARPFPVRQRIRKHRVQVQTIVVRPPGKRRASAGQTAARPMDALDEELVSVRGSFARYGVEGRQGLLFGKYAGKFWRPAHARGAGEPAGPRSYLLKP
jgi:hypothetical protein